MFLPGLAVVFAGIAGQHDHRVDRQLRALTAELHVASATLSATELATIGHHGDGARGIVARLHADGVIAGEYVTSGGHASVRIFIYGGDGGMRSMLETPLAGSALSSDDLAGIRANLADEVGELTPAAVRPAAAPDSAPAPDGDDSPVRAPARIAATSAAPAARPSRARAEPPPTEPDPSTSPAPEPAATAPPSSDSVSVAELEALTADAPADDAGHASATAPEADASNSDLHLRAAMGFGVAARSFSPGPSTVPAYSSSGVGVVRFAAGIQPTARISLSGLAERTLEMTTPVDSQMAATSFSRWELSADYALGHGAVEVMPEAGLGHRSFSIASTSAASSPATDYSYAILGARVRAALGPRVAIHAHLAFEPVLGGSDPMEMTFGSATRWAVDAGAALELRPYKHLFARVAADYQRFSWSWDQAGARGAGGAVDSYPSGTISLGADY